MMLPVIVNVFFSWAGGGGGGRCFEVRQLKYIISKMSSLRYLFLTHSCL